MLISNMLYVTLLNIIVNKPIEIIDVKIIILKGHKKYVWIRSVLVDAGYKR